ncbi:MAG: peptidoglycan DD-metalloendopeptidase family protein, partial [Planctomycetota bacterium]
RGVAVGDSTGFRVRSVGDLNGDTLADFLVTAPAADADLAGDGVLTDNVGQTFVVYGRFGGFAGGFDLADLLPANGGDGSQGFVLQGIKVDDNSGISVTTGGDFNKDGYNDLVIGAPNADRAGNRSGEAYVVFGRATGFPATVNLKTLSFVGGGNGAAGFILVGERTGDLAGTSVSFAGDINDDGFDDLIIGSPQADFQVGTTSLFNAGRAYVIYGSDQPFPAEYSLANLLTPLTPGMVQRGFVIDGETSFDNVGQSVAGLGDINGDGIDDVAIGALHIATNFSGDVYELFGRDATTQFFTPITNPFSLTQLRTAQLGDGTLGSVFHGDVNGDNTGSLVVGLGDINGDTINDFAIGAPSAGLDVRPSGLAYLVYGKKTPFSAETDLRTLLPLFGGDGTAGVVVQGGNTNDQIGSAIAPLGDFNGDGFPDVAFGAPGLDDAGNNAGGVYIVYGSATPLPKVVDLIALGQAGATPGMLLLGLTGSQTGTSVSGLGDVNGDGRSDLVIGSPLLSVNGDAVGGGYVVEGRAGGYRRIVSLGLLDPTGDQPLEIDHGNGWVTRYSHLNLDSVTVQVGDQVKAGDILGLVGDRALGEARLKFDVLHRGSVVETYLDPAAYWLHPLTYQGSTTQLPLVAGVTNVDPTSSLEEGPTSISRLHPTFTGPMYYWNRVSHLNPYDEWQVTWIRPDGVRLADAYSCQLPKTSPIFSTTTPFCQNLVSSPNHFPLITSSRSVNWKDYPGTWQVQFKVNGQIRNIERFTIASSPIEPKIRVTMGSVAPNYDLIVNQRQTPLDFGELKVNDSSPTIQLHIENRGATALRLNGITVPAGFVLRSALPAQVNVADSATLLLEMDTTLPGTPFGEVVINSDDPAEPVYKFLVEGRVIGSLPAGAPQVQLPSGPVAYLWGSAPVIVDPQALLSDIDSLNFSTGSLSVAIVANGTADDQLALTTSGPVTQVGNQVVYGGLSIGTIRGGIGTDPLVVSLNSDATPEAVQALLRGVTYANSAQAPGSQSRYLRFSVTDDTGKQNQSALQRVVLGPSNQNQFPVVGLLTADPSPVVQPASMSLIASGVFDIDGLVQKVSFYVE